MSPIAPMPIVQLRPKRQLTIPTDLAEAAGLKVGDYIELVLENGQLVIKPKDFADRRPHRRLTDMIGAARGLYASAEDIDAEIAHSRAE